jgi:AcrR family transcriptional regulator
MAGSTVERTRTRRTAKEAKQVILEAAERRLISDGPEGVRVQLIARDLGMTDAAIHHHFGSRDGLVEALLKFGGRKLKARVGTATAGWDDGAIDVPALIDVITETYGDRGYARLATWMALAGWRSQGSGMFRPLAEAIHAARTRIAEAQGRPAPPLEDTLFSVTMLSLVLFAEPLHGNNMRRSVSLPADRETRDRFVAWLAALMQRHLRHGDP